MSVLIAMLLLAAPAADSGAQAREHFKAAQLHYSLGEFEDAAKEFREAYRLRQEPAILFNLAQAYRQLRQYREAYFYYRQYLNQKKDAPNREEAESLMEEMRQRMDSEEEQRTRVAASPEKHSESVIPAAAPPAATEATPAAAPPPQHRFRTAGYALLGAGVVAEGVALAMHGSAASAANQFNQHYQSGQLTSSDAALRDSAQSKGKVATAALLGGAALLALGAVFTFAF